jgi:hypothetical protein
MSPITADATETPVIMQVYRRREESSTPADLEKRPYRVSIGTPLLASIPGGESNYDPTPMQREIDEAWNPSSGRQTQTTQAAVEEQAMFTAGDLDEAERIADQRAFLLAQRYALRGASKEQQARLNLLTERLKVLLPPVTEEELETLEKIALSGQAVRDRFAEIRRRLSIG